MRGALSLFLHMYNIFHLLLSRICSTSISLKICGP
ncbi:hypothetical protein I314_02052 [Cryptococcus bacillisporus CA1873]|uniref:Unplaced genomic scaffold supercont1.4, whole genome shotgun sequence n=2 Tax=Cryptococcus gattii TaxID=552467 RepID=A0A0D0VTQ5_CRYGA|nr:hypothetical protein I312_01880 [Cryptococcus bacillisporus CA1280]KIR67635.1 hypothetical protein I314_02052 [Cryptococcus bacillisporus CA1873]|eukprot:KIR67635.1 hypothetical protein I314_02052 [Cryptococcus gattii CA1873]